VRNGKTAKWIAKVVEGFRIETECQRAMLGKWLGAYDLIFYGAIGILAVLYGTLTRTSALFAIPFLVSVLALLWADSRITSQGKLILEKNPLLLEPKSKGEFL
jgi:hypothetical protein